MVTQVPSGGLTSVEQSLVEHVSRGEPLDLAADDEAVDEAAMRSWGESRTCRASVIRDILRGRLAADPDPHGLRLRGARITGRLDLENLTTDVNLELKDCLLEEGVLARDARLACVVLIGCQVEHPAEPPLDGARLTCSVLVLSGARVIGHADDGAVHLLGAHIGGELDCTGAELRNDSGPALSADGLQVDQDMFLTGGFTATGSGGAGAVRLPGAHIGGQLDCTGANLRNDSGPALIADSLQVDQAMLLRGFTATGSGDTGAVRLIGAHIGGQLNCTGAELRNDSGPALSRTACRSARTCSWAGSPPPAAATAARSACTAPASAASSTATGAKLRNDSGPALFADSLQVDQGMFLAAGSPPPAAAAVGAVRLVGAHIGGQLDCDRGEAGQRLRPRPVRRQPASRPGHVPAPASSPPPAAARWRGPPARRPHRRPAPLRRGEGWATTPALPCSPTACRSARTCFSPVGSPPSGGGGTVHLPAPTSAASCTCTGADLRNDSGPALLADSLQVGQDMYLTGGFTATGGGGTATVDLTGARVGGALLFAPARLEHKAKSHRRLAVDGLTYAGVPEPQPISTEAWRDLLRHGTPGYAAQPYQQLAAGYRAQGDDRQARKTLMAQRDDQLARAGPSRPERVWGRITKVTLGYGYQPWRALLFLAGVLAVSCVLAVVLGAHGALAQTSKTATPGRSCTVVQQISVGLDLNLPVGTSVARAGCDLTTDSASVTAAWLTAVGWVLRLLAWAFAALFIAGFTSAVRKT